MKRSGHAFLFVALLTAVALGFPGEAQAHTWSIVTVDSEGEVGTHTSIAVDANGDPLISYRDWTQFGPYSDLKFAICDVSDSANGNCDEQDDWNTVTVDATEWVGHDTSIAVDASGNPMISYADFTNYDLKFAICDRSASTNDNCDQQGDWSTTPADGGWGVGRYTSIALDASGNPMISYRDGAQNDLKFAICDRSASAHGNCDQQGDWNTVTVDAAQEPGSGDVGLGFYTSIAVGLSGDPMISHYDYTNNDLRFAICDRPASTNGNCDERGDWSTTTVDVVGDVGRDTSIAVDAGGNPMISYGDLTNCALKFAICALSASANGNCDEQDDWNTTPVDTVAWVGNDTSIAVSANGDPMISHYNAWMTGGDLRFAICDLPASTNGNCDQQGDWSTETVDSEGNVGGYTSIAVGGNGEPVISYYDLTNRDLKFAIGSPPSLTNCGDVDCDDDVDAVDAMFILQYVVGTRSASDQCPPPEGHLYLPAGDVDCDDDVDAVDALFVLQHVVDLRPELCVCPAP